MLMGGNIVDVPSVHSFLGWAWVWFGMLLGPEGTSPALQRAGFVVLKCRVRIPVLIPAGGLFGQVAGVWWVVLGVCGLVGVCELDSGCEHLVVMFCGLFLCVC